MKNKMEINETKVGEERGGEGRKRNMGCCCLKIPKILQMFLRGLSLFPVIP